MNTVERIDLRRETGGDRMCVWETDHFQIMRIRLGVGESLPHHNSNAHVVLLPLTGTVRLVTPERTEVFSVGEAVSVPYDTPMDVSNGGQTAALFLVLKTPHPRTVRS